MLRELLSPFENMGGVMLDRNKILDGNALLYTGHKIVLLDTLGELDMLKDGSTYSCMLASVERLPGLIDRYGKPGDKQQHDDYLGLFAAGAILNRSFAQRAVSYGRKNFYSWNNQDPGKWTLWSFFVRQPGFWATAKAAAGKWLNPFDELMAVVDLMDSIYSEGSSGKLMDYLQYKTYVRSCPWHLNPFLRTGCLLYKILYMKKYPKGIKESFAEYFGPEYPFSLVPDGTF